MDHVKNACKKLVLSYGGPGHARTLLRHEYWTANFVPSEILALVSAGARVDAFYMKAYARAVENCKAGISNPIYFTFRPTRSLRDVSPKWTQSVIRVTQALRVTSDAHANNGWTT